MGCDTHHVHEQTNILLSQDLFLRGFTVLKSGVERRLPVCGSIFIPVLCFFSVDWAVPGVQAIIIIIFFL